MKEDYFRYIISGIFGIVGIILLVVCFFITKSNIEFEKKAVTITGVITDIDTYRDSDGDKHYVAYANYSYEGKKYENVRLSYSSSSMRVRQSITLKIDPDDPYIVKTEGESIFASILLGAMGLAFSLLGIIPLINCLRNNVRTNNLIQQGRYIYGIVENIELNYCISVNGKHPYVLYCYYEDAYSGTIYKFKSDNIWTDPTPGLPIGSQVRIYVKNNDYSDYHVDVNGSLQCKIVDYT